jgi:uncharacterized protein (TIGR01777 family)
VSEVFAWHSRPGAIRRLTPPWQPVHVEREADSLADGVAVLSFPGGIRWRASHDPEAFEEGRRFVDVLTTPLLRSLIPWRHVHEFVPTSDCATKVVDQVDTRVPDRVLARIFRYRSRQLVDDMAAHKLWSSRPLTVAVTGSSGTVGSALCALLETGGHRVIRLVRRISESPGLETNLAARYWEPGAPDRDLLKGVDALVHLAGASVAGRFTIAHRSAIRTSRVGPTCRLAELVARSKVPTMVTASAIGYYGPDRGDELLTEDSDRGSGFLCEVVADWEADTAPATEAGSRVVMVRTGIVQSPAGGSLRLLKRLFQLGAGGPIGSGRQWMSWIGIDDLLDIYLRSIADPSLSGPVNAVSPNPVRNDEYAKVLARVLHRPGVVPTPAFGPALLLGREGARELALASQRVVPARLSALGHRFRHPEIEGALRHLLGR